MEFINLINSAGITKKDVDGLTAKDIALSSVIKHKQVRNKGLLSSFDSEILHKGKVKLRVHKEDNIIKQLEYICSCGENAIIDVEYIDSDVEVDNA